MGASHLRRALRVPCKEKSKFLTNRLVLCPILLYNRHKRSMGIRRVAVCRVPYRAIFPLNTADGLRLHRRLAVSQFLSSLFRKQVCSQRSYRQQRVLTCSRAVLSFARRRFFLSDRPHADSIPLSSCGRKEVIYSNNNRTQDCFVIAKQACVFHFESR